MSRDAVLLSLYNALVSGASVQKLIDIMRMHIGNPVALCDSNLKPIAYSQEHGIDDTVWAQVTSEDESIHYKFEDFGMKSGLIQKVNSSREPVLIADASLDHRYMNSALFCNGNVIGNMVLIEYFREFTEDDKYLLGQFSKMVAFAETRTDLEYVRDPSAELVMMRLLNGDYVSTKTISRYLFKEKEQYGYVAAVMVSVDKRVSHRILSVEQRILMSKYPRQRVAIYHESLVAIFQIPLHGGKDALDWGELERTAAEMKLLCGLSKPFRELAELKEFYEQAKDALSYGERYIGNRSCYLYQDVSFLHLLDVAGRDGGLAKFCHPAFHALLEYDIQNGTKWIRSLYYYLYFNCNINAAADALGINRNSMYYRINKIQEIVGPCFQSPNFATQMKLSVNILSFLDGESFFELNDIPPELRTASFF